MGRGNEMIMLGFWIAFWLIVIVIGVFAFIIWLGSLFQRQDERAVRREHARHQHDPAKPVPHFDEQAYQA